MIGNFELFLLQGQQAFDYASPFRISLACEKILEMGDIGMRYEAVHAASYAPFLFPSELS